MSIIERNVEKLGIKFLKELKYKDIDYRGFINDHADPTLEAGAVMINDLKLWIQSTAGDYYRRYDMGGFFDSIRKYPLSQNGADILTSELKAAITKNFPTVEVLNLTVTPVVDRRGWKIQLIVKDSFTGIISPLITEVSA